METGYSLIKPLSAGVNPNGGIIKAADYESLLEANNLLDAARKEADSIMAQARQRAEQVLQDGYKDGISIARQECAERLITARIRANQMMQMAETDLVQLVKLTLERILGGIDDEQKMIGMIQSGLTSLRNDYRVLIRVAPEMENKVKATLPQIKENHPGVEYFEVVADTRISREMCVLEGDAGIIKCSISDQFARLNELIETALGDR
ncbi:flagellar biosynthesis/type III secretory pathway protein [Hahella sp. CCB-MM4]|uniref:type III secretion system stator protein SctL n=1 Tax=Hahella sp. (strain CCB-MM4) TaxID=1926491 RepID=UPI000B9A2709|nr:type III secretion system stator protein SctL [Hahella sp. CCB-MM4]OZG74357.1 flagellar biosynthesis/type III secretory pathway protein [Hahella sp. CCB-MM4]